MPPDIEIRGLDELYRRLDEATATRTLYPPMERSLERVRGPMQVYPPPPPDSTYKRTGKYGQAWTVKIDEVGNGLSGRVGNNIKDERGVPYGPWVGSKQWQAAVHQGRWNTDQDVLDAAAPAIVADFEAAIAAALEGK